MTCVILLHFNDNIIYVHFFINLIIVAKDLDLKYKYYIISYIANKQTSFHIWQLSKYSPTFELKKCEHLNNIFSNKY